LNLFDICMEVLEHAYDLEMNLEDEVCRESISTEIYDLFYEHQVYPHHSNNGYIGDLKEYWDYKQDLDEED
jgi:hypothetical protein